MNLSVLREGIPGWEKRGYPVQASPERAKTVSMPRLAPRDLQKLLTESPGAILLLDVREQSEYEEGHVPGATNLPLSRLAAGPVDLERGKRIVIYCATGARNYNAWRILTRQGYRIDFQAVFAEWRSDGLPVEKPEPTRAR